MSTITNSKRFIITDTLDNSFCAEFDSLNEAETYVMVSVEDYLVVTDTVTGKTYDYDDCLDFF